MHAAALVCHPESPSAVARNVNVRVARTGGVLAVNYVIAGEVARLRVPPPRAPRIAQRLWRHTCCEIFIARNGLPAYHEFNFVPSGEWAAFAFARYRDGGPLADESLEPRIAVHGAADTLALDAEIWLDRLSAAHAGAKLSLALATVIEDDTGALSYWALKHAPGKPDFHHPDAFALELDEVRH
jgi:hypothetical protein